MALKNVFKGPDAQLRIVKKIRKLIQKHPRGIVLLTLKIFPQLPNFD